jgi:hypothetical protein
MIELTGAVVCGLICGGLCGLITLFILVLRNFMIDVEELRVLEEKEQAVFDQLSVEPNKKEYYIEEYNKIHNCTHTCKEECITYKQVT